METSFHITNYVNNGWSPLQCVIKKLYSDFTVQEITEAGEVVPLRSVEEAEKSFKEFTQKATKSSDVAVPKEVPAPPVITDEICVLFDSLMTKSIENVVVDCAGLDKAERKGVHEYIRNNYGGNLDSSTSGDNIVVTSSKNIPRNRKRAMWPDSLPDYVHFTMAKEFKDSHFALETLSKYLHINSNRFATAGTKDRRAITTQRVSVYRTEPDKLHKLNKNLRGIRLYDYSYESEPLKLGNLQGNRFTIVLRDLVMPEGTCEDLKAHITERIEQWKESGFINYFGTQRFGTCGVSTAEVGKLILKSDYEGAVNLLLSGMNNTGEGSGGRTIENSVKQHLEKNAKDFKGAIMRIPRSTRSMYAHAYQSAVFNKVVSRRVDKHGTSALPGDVTLNATSPTSFNVRMPLPSHDVIYPENEVSEWYHKTLEEDGVTRQDFAAVAKEFAIGSVFRHAFVKPQNVEYSFKEGYEPHEHLMPDLEHYPECCPIDKSRRPGDDGNTAATKPSLALVITFSLPPGSYATVALRELIRSDLGKEAMNVLKMSLELLQKSLDLVNEGDGIDTGKKKIKKKLNARKRMIEEGKRLLKQVDLDKEFDVDTCEVVRKKKKRGIQRQAIEHSDRLAREGFSYVEQVREQRPPDLMKRNMRYMKFVEQRRVEDDVMARIAGHHLKGADQRKKFVKEILDAKDGKRKKTAKSKSVFTDADFANAASSTIHSLNRQSNKVKLDKKTGKPIVKPTELAKPDFDYDEDEDAESAMDRRRGGAKSASSSRAAELLRSQGFQVGFVGFGEATNIFQQGGADSKPSVEIDPEIRAAFGKLTKKDRRTREGALDSLAKILQVKNEEEVKCSFGYYVGNYSTFVTDCSAAFRAEANNVLKMYIRRLKKEIQEELKQILPLVLFSTYDAQNMVAKSAGAIFTECFDEEKRAKIRAAFASGTVSIAVQIINRSHKLVQPQKFTDEESDEDRVNRLVAQSLAALHDLGETADVALLQEMTTNSTTVSKLLSMPENVRSSLFLLFTRLLRADIEPFFATKVPSSVLSSLDSKNVALSRNAFECFLLFADAEQFYEVVKIEKAVIPKFVAMIRKKDRHWLVLEAYLLPSFALIYKHLPTEDHKSKLMRSIVESFFDGNVLENAFPVKSWSKAFGELVQFSFLNSSMKSDLDFLATKIFAYLDTVIDANDSESLTSAASLLSWLYKKDLATTEFRNTLELNMKNKLPSSATLLERFLPELEHQDRMIQESFLSCTAIPNSLLLKLLPFSQNKHDLLTPKDFAHRIEREENSDIRILLLNELIEFLNEYSCDETLDTLLRLESISTSCEVIASLAKNEKNWNDRILPAIPRVKSLNRVAGHILLHKEPSSIWIYWDDVVTALGFLRTDELNSFLEEWMPFIEPSHLERFADLLKEDSAELKNLNDHMRERAQIKLISLLIQQPTGVIASTQEIRKAIDVVTGFSSKPDSERLRDEIDGLMGFDLSTEHVRFAAEVILKCGLQDIMFTDQKHFNSFCEQLDIYSENFVAEGLELLPLLTNFKRRHEKLDVREYLRRAYFYALIIRDQPRTTNDMTFATVVVCAALGEFLVNKKLVPREWDEEIKESVSRLTEIILEKQESWKTDFVMSIRPLPPQCSYYMAVRYLQGFAFRKTCIDVPIIKREFEKDHDEKYLALLVALKSFMRHQDIVPCQGLSEVAKAAWAAEFMSMRKGYSEETAVEYWELNNVGGDEADDEEDLRKLVETHGFDSFLFSYAKDSEDSVSHNILTSTYARLLSRLHATYLVEQENALCPDSRDFMDAALVTMLDVLSSADMNEKAAWIFDVYATMAARLYRRYIEDYIATASIELPSDHIRDCREAWRDFLFPTCSPAFVSYFLHRSNVHLGNAPHYLAVEVSRTVCSMKTAEFSFKDMNLPSSVDPTLDQLKYSEELQNVLAPVLGMICASPQAPVCAQLAAVQILKSLIPDMFAHENKENYDREKEGKCTLTKFKLPYVLEDTLKTINCTDQWQNIPPALLVWDALMDYALLLDVSEKFTFCRSLESDENRLQGELITILTTIYTKLPDSPALLEKTIRTKRVIVEESLILQDNCTGILFTQKPCHENFYHGHYYANLFYRTITAIPAHVRDWAKSLNKMHYAIVDKFIQQNISPLLIKHELQNMKAAAAADKKENLQIRIMPAIGQITAEYKFEDSSMVLNIVIPTDYPLSLPNVNYEKKMLEVQKQRKWLLQLIAFLTHQNGSMWDGVNQWRRSIEDHMEGVEECLICFSTVSADNFQLPKIQCKPCKKKFHGSCLYKWFESKDVPTCPHCRASFL